MNHADWNPLTNFKSPVLIFVLVALAYYGTARLGLMVPYKESIAALIWLPTGIAAGAIMRWGRISFPAIYVAAFFAELSIGMPYLTCAAIAFTNTLAPFFAAYLFKKSNFNHSIIKQKDIALLILIALIGMLVSATGGVLVLMLSGLTSPENIIKVWFIWWVGDSVGVLLALPLVLNLGKVRMHVQAYQYRQLFAWLCIYVIGELMIALLVPGVNKQFMLSIFLILPILIWASMNFGIVGGSLVVISLSSIAVWFSAQGYGGFYSVNMSEGIFSLWTFMVTLAVTMLLIAALQAERNLAEKALRDNDKKLRTVIDGALDAIMTIDDAGNLVEFNPAAEKIFGYQKEQVLGRRMSEMIIPPQLRKFHDEGHQHYVLTGEKSMFNQRVEITGMRADGSEFPVELTLTALKDENLSLVTGFIRDISVQKKAQQEIENFAYYDALTGLPNRRLFTDRFQHAVLISQRSKTYCALIFIDLDNFKTLNDTKGHSVGDQMLIEVAHRIKQVIRAGDTVARLSGDEFIVIIENLDAQKNLAYQQASEVTQKLLAELNRSYCLDLFEFNTSASIGVTLFNNDHLSFEEHLRHADIAMYQSKAAGRNTYHFYDRITQERIEKIFAIETALAVALKNQEFHLHYQSIVDVNQVSIAAEVLLRWVHPVMGNIGPAEFIPIAEKNNRIIKIGHWVLQQACQQLKVWESNSNPQLSKMKLSVNISAKQFLYINFIQELREILATTGIDPDRLKLELTETAVIDNIDDVFNKIQVLKQMGVRVSLDDFGIGHSSLVYLKKLPVTQIKIDQSFVRDALTDTSDAAIIRMVLAVGQAMQCGVVAEGIECLEQFELLKTFGCEYFQGFYFSRPMTADNFERQLAAT